MSGKLPVLAFGSTFKKNGDGIQLRRYNGYVLLEVNGLESQSEAEAVRREAAALPQTLLAFVGLSGRSDPHSSGTPATGTVLSTI